MLDIQKNECMGCQQCSVTCPHNAISFKVIDGFYYPYIDKTKCISCGLCELKCPAFNDASSNNVRPIVYSAWTLDDEQRVKSTSGGICYELSKYIIDNGGSVAGVVWTDDFKDAKYEIIHDYDGLNRISQTKYFQPKADGIYKDVKKCLDNDEVILFIGTACYCEALRLYLGKEYRNLIICDFICRGYTSQLFHAKRVEDLEKKKNSKVSFVQYKNKKNGWNDFGTLFEFCNGEKYFVGRHEDPYENMFMIDDYNTRPSCFDCKYRNVIRKSDITVGDFWGIKNVDIDDMNKGVSAVLLNSQKGCELFSKIENKIMYEKRDIVEVLAENGALRNSYIRKTGAENFFKDLNNKSMDYIYKKYAPKREGRKLVSMLNKIRMLLKCNIFQFIRYNYFCSSVTRDKGCYLIPLKGSIIKIDKGSTLNLKGNLVLNTLKHVGAKEYMYLSIYRGASVEIKGKTTISTGSTIDVLENSKMEIGSMDANIGLVLICDNMIKMGYDVQIGRGVLIYDSNHHKTALNKQEKLRPLQIGDHVWICTGVTIAKGVKIGSGAICGINATIMSNVKEHSMFMGNPAKKVMEYVEW